jgi:hypothetical protein
LRASRVSFGRVECYDFSMVARNETAARQDRLAAIKRSIAQGTYETPQKLDQAVEAFVKSQDELNAEHRSGGPQLPR